MQEKLREEIPPETMTDCYPEPETADDCYPEPETMTDWDAEEAYLEPET